MHVLSFTAPELLLGLLGLLILWGVFSGCTFVLAQLAWPPPPRTEREREQPQQLFVPHGWT